MENIIKRGKSEKVCKKQGRISRGGGEKFIWLARIYMPESWPIRLYLLNRIFTKLGLVTFELLHT